MMKQASRKALVIVSTQSPLLLDHFRPDDVLVADRVDGATQFTRLESAPLATWLEDYSLGQLWEMAKRKKSPEITFQDHIAAFLCREHKYGVLEQTDIIDTGTASPKTISGLT